MQLARQLIARGSRSVVGAGAMVFCATLIWSFGGFAFSALAGHLMSVSDYGTLYSVISLYAVAIVPATVFSPVVAKYAAEFDALSDVSHGRGLFAIVMRMFIGIGLLYVIVPVIFQDLLAGFLRLAPWELVTVGVMAGVSMLATAIRGIGQGIHAYRLYSASIVIEGIGRVVGLLFFAFLGLTVARAAWGFLFGLVLGACVIIVPLCVRYSRTPAAVVRLDWKRIIQTTAAASSLAVAMSFMGYLDVVIVKHFFTGTEAGLYAASSLVGKILLYVVSFVPAMLIPQATNRGAKGRGTRGVLWMWFAFVSAVVVLGVSIYALESRLVLHLFVGTKFDAAISLVPVYAIAMAALALTNTVGSYALATHRLAFVVPLGCTAIATIVAIAVAHPSLYAVTAEMAIGNVVMLASVAIPLAMQGWAGTRQPAIL